MRLPPPSPTYPHPSPTLQNPTTLPPTPTFYWGVGVVGGKVKTLNTVPHLDHLKGNEGVMPVPTLEHDDLVFCFPNLEANSSFQIDFQRTLRIPASQGTYCLPPGLGAFPLRHADDYPAKVVVPWLAEDALEFAEQYQTWTARDVCILFILLVRP